jgi:CxxC motif-containing protein
MTKELVCIVCPRGCRMRLAEEDGALRITGNGCKRGAAFAESEWRDPRRTICTTVRTAFPAVPVLPVRVSAPIPKNRIFDVMREVNRVTVTTRPGRGDIILENVLGLGVNVIATSNVLKETDV